MPVSVDEAHDVASCRVAAELFTAVWQAEVPPVTGELLRAMSHEGHYVALARHHDGVIGASFAVVSPGDGGRLHLHSHITGVLAEHRRTGAGLALKRHQQDWAAAHGCDTVTWTFDPLVARNGWFNLVCLGAVVVDHLPDFYGPMADAFNLSDETDRFFVRWDVSTRTAGDGPDPARIRHRDELAERGGVDVVEVDAGGAPHTASPVDPAAPRLCAVPGDIVTLRRDAPMLAKAWREAVGVAARRAIDDGFVAASMTPDRAYVFEPVAERAS